MLKKNTSGTLRVEGCMMCAFTFQLVIPTDSKNIKKTFGKTSAILLSTKPGGFCNHLTGFKTKQFQNSVTPLRSW